MYESDKGRRMRYGIRTCFLFRSILIIVAVVLLAFSCTPRKTEKFNIGILGVYTFTVAIDGFKSGLAESGYIEGKNIEYDTFILVSTTHDEERAKIRSTLEKYINDKVSLIFVMGTPLSIMAKEMTQDTGIPVVFANALVEVENVIRSVRDPGGNITGVRFPGIDLTVRRFELLMRLVPYAKRVWLAYDPDNSSAAPAIEALRPVALSAGVTLIEVKIKSVEDIKTDIKKREAAGDPDIDAIFIMPEGISQSPDGWGTISKFAEDRGIPVIGSAAFEADQGAVLTLIPDDNEIGRTAAKLTAKILKGIPAGSIPVVSPESRLRLNYNRAKKLGLRIDDGLLKLADEIIE